MKRILIANRGEIACRIVRACRQLGIRSVAVFSDVDARALHVRMADDAVPIGLAPPRESYLDIGRILSAAKSASADAVHPGYGFLAENAGFARAVADASLTFIGPPAPILQTMGRKTTAREMAARLGIAVAPGFAIPVDGMDATHLAQARAIGYPVLIKASAGGGGRGMRPITQEVEFAPAIESARREATASFGDGQLLVEKLIASPRHIEVQIVADARGEVAHLFERECSIQRRHQKIIEESPSPCADAALRRRLCDAAVHLARTAGYVNAGTVEFLVDAQGAMYFLELNARLQVEHPVTECVTGADLVQAQIKIAAGMSLAEALGSSLPGTPVGHALECRICAEDAANDFLPSTGRITRWIEPRDVRVESGCAAGDVVTPHYDSLLAKVIAHGATRAEACARMDAALAQFIVEGVTTNIDFLRDVIRHPSFACGETTTDFVRRHFASWQPRGDDSRVAFAPDLADANPWRQRNRFRVGQAGRGVARDMPAASRSTVERTDRMYRDDAPAHVDSPLPAIVRQVFAHAGGGVKRGETLVVLEAMKMELRLAAPQDGVVRRVACEAGQTVERGQVLVEFEG
jgi:acetyl/propionyl-CoA carboxylase alpha subunit